MAAEPYIYSKNYVNADDVFTVSHGAAAIGNIYDRDKDSQWISSGADSDATSATITVSFYESSSPASRTFDTVILINHNLKSYTLQAWNGSDWDSAFITKSNDASQSAAVNASAYGNTGAPIATFSPVTTSKILLTLNTTQTADEEKAIGELVVCNTQLALGVDLSSYQIAYRQKVWEIPLGDGSLHVAVVPWTPNRIDKYECSWSIDFVPESTRRSLLAIKQSGRPFLWYPESITRPDDIWYCHWYDPRQYAYSSGMKGSGSTMSGQFKEV